MSHIRRFRDSLVLGIFVLVLGISPAAAAQTASQAAIDEWLEKDSFTRCDPIGWSFADGVLLSDLGVDGDGEVMWPSCLGGRGTAAACGTIQGDGSYFTPPTNQNWIACYLYISNGGSSPFDISMFDFSLVDSDGRKYTNDLTAQASIDTRWMIPTTTLRSRQSVEGAIVFSVPKNAEMPLILEIEPLLDLSFGNKEIGQIIIPTLVSVHGLFN